MHVAVVDRDGVVVGHVLPRSVEGRQCVVDLPGLGSSDKRYKDIVINKVGILLNQLGRLKMLREAGLQLLRSGVQAEQGRLRVLTVPARVLSVAA